MVHCEAQFDALSANLSNTSGRPEPDTSVVDQRVQLRIALQHLAAHSRQLDGFLIQTFNIDIASVVNIP
jgi:hypothetical protein